MNINIMIGYDDHTSTYAVDDNIATHLLEMDDTNTINDYIVSQGYYVSDAYESQQANIFLDLYVDDISLFHDNVREELSVSP